MAPYSHLPQSASQEDDTYPPSPHQALPPQPPLFSSSTTSLPDSVDSYKDEVDNSLTEDEEDGGRWSDRRGARHTKGSRRRSLGIILAIILFAVLIGILSAASWVSPSSYYYARPTIKRHMTMDHVFNYTFSPDVVSLSWVKEAGDGIYSTEEDGAIWLRDVNDRNSSNLLFNSTETINPVTNEPLHFSSWQLSPDLQYILFQTDRTQQWRHSSHSHFFLHSLLTNHTFPLLTTKSSDSAAPPKITYASWSPVGHHIAFVQSNDLYVLPSDSIDPSRGIVGEPFRVTTDGDSNIFNGVPDWVYEEEVFSNDYAMWWSPGGEEVAFLRFNETDVREFEYPIYDPNEDLHAHPYPQEVVMKYPKPGYANPLVSLHLFPLPSSSLHPSLSALSSVSKSASHSHSPPTPKFLDLTWPGQKKPTDQIIFEVAWLKEGALVVKESDRSATSGNVVVFELGKIGEDGVKLDEGGEVLEFKGNVTRELVGGEGWIEQSQTIASYAGGYLDITPSAEGYNHLAFFPSPLASEPIWITKGEWEVVQLNAVDEKKGFAYFTAANPSIERHIYSATVPKVQTKVNGEAVEFDPFLTPLTDVKRSGYYSASFSPEAGFYLLTSSGGTDVPWQRVMKVDEPSFDYLLEDNLFLNETLSEFILPIVNYGTVTVDSYELNVKEIRPVGMDESGKTKYPILLAPYGGPNSQSVNVRYGISWASYLAAELKYIVLVVDGRGTGFKGRDLRNPIRGKVGTFEAIDQIEAARSWAASKSYVDPRRIGIWGWSFGGYLTGKVLERDTISDASIFSLGMAVAPVTDWQFYDSVYTERYMMTPEVNPDGYAASGINNVTQFSTVDFLLAHGSADDNVHFANSAALLEKLTRVKDRSFVFRMFTDSNHGINRGGANRELYEWMTSFLLEKWGKGGKRRGW